MWLIFFSPTLFGGQVYFADDLKAIYYPLESEYARAQHEWRLPQWSPHFGFGQPLLAWGQLGFFTPLHLLLRALYIEPLLLLQLSMACYFLAGLLGMYLFLCRSVRPSAAALGSLVFVFSGFHVGHLLHVNFYTATMVLPWLLLASERFLHRPTPRRAALLALAGAAIALSGQPQVVLYTFLAAAVYAFTVLVRYSARAGGRSRYLARVALFGALALVAALLLSAFALLPLREFLPLTDRNTALTEEELLDFSYPPRHAVTLLLPTFFGDAATYWGSKSFEELSAFVGLIPLALASVGLLGQQGQRYTVLRVTGATLLVLGVLGALGKYSPLYEYLVLHKYLTTLAVPARFVFMFTTGTALLAALGLQRLAEQNDRPLFLLRGLFLLPLATLAPFLMALAYDGELQRKLLPSLQASGLAVTVTAGGLVLLLATVLLRTRIKSSWWSYLVVACSGATLVMYGFNYNPRTSWQEAHMPSAVDAYLQAYRGQHGVPARLYARGNINLPEPPLESFPAFASDASRETVARTRHLQVVAGASSPHWVGALALREYRAFIATFFANDGRQIDGDGIDITKRRRAIFDLAGVTHVVSTVPRGAPETVAANNFRLRETVYTPNYELRVYENPTVYPKAFLIFSAEFQDVAEEIRAALRDEEFDPARRVFVSGPVPPPVLPDNDTRAAELAPVSRYEPTHIALETNADETAVVVVSDATTPQWHARIDGQAAPYYVANSVFKAAVVPPGKHTVEFVYRSPAIATARYSMLAGIGLTAAALAWPRLEGLSQKSGLVFRD